MTSRGDASAYDRYLAAMDAAMRQKIAVLAAHLLGRGRVADMGMGSGSGSDALAALYPALEVVGVDLDPEMVERARGEFRRPNLSFVVGDVGAVVFELGSLDGVFNSSVLHHVTSFGGYDHDAAGRALIAQARQLALGGTLVVRDFLAPPDDEPVVLAVRSDDGDASSDPRTCSTAALLERFATEFRSLHERTGFPLAPLPETRPGWKRYELSHRAAVEMVLRKDYRQDWEKEVREEYCYFDQTQFEAAFESAGLRVLASTPIRNPWIVRNRFDGQFELTRVDGTPIETTATNYVIAGEKVGAEEGVRFGVEDIGATSPRYLHMEAWRDVQTGAVHDLVRRPNPALDVVPYFRDDEGDPFIVARMSYPRPILTRAGAALDGSRPPEWVTEPLVAVMDGSDPATLATETLQAWAGVEKIRGEHAGHTLYPSPGGILEEVRSHFVGIDPLFVVEARGGTSGFASDGRLRSIEGRQLLRAAQVGALPDARTELHTYQLFRRLGLSPGPWIGTELRLDTGRVEPTPLAALLRGVRRRFEPAEQTTGFLEIHAATFVERDRNGDPLATQQLEWVVPSPFSARTLSCAILMMVDDVPMLAIDDDDRPASMALDGNSRLLVAPAFRLPFGVKTLPHGRRWLAERLRAQYDIDVQFSGELGGRYHPSPGLTPEVVHPLAMTTTDPGRGLSWVELGEALTLSEHVRDLHLRVVILRAAHALGLMEAPPAGAKNDLGSASA